MKNTDWRVRLTKNLISWLSPAGGDWDMPANWDLGRVPDAADDAVIAFSGITVTHASAIEDEVNSLTCAADLNFSDGKLTITANSTIAGTFGMSRGELAGTGNVTVTGLLTWTVPA